MEYEMCSVPTTSTVSLRYEKLPYFLIQQIGEELDLDDRLNFMATSPHLFNSLKSSFRKFTYMQISDEPYQNFVKGDGKQYVFSGPYLIQLLQVCTGLKQVSIAVKPPLGLMPENATNCPVFDSTLYHANGYIGKFCEVAPSFLLDSLKSISLNIDFSVSSFSHLQMGCPVEDLFFSVTHLARCSFNTFIQIGFCASNYNLNDWPVNRVYLRAMHQICEQMRFMGCKAMVDLGGSDGYVDLSVEVGNLEYSFAYFYYNPKICEPHNDSDELEEEFVEFNELVLSQALNLSQMYEKSNPKMLSIYDMGGNDLFRAL